MVVRGPLGSLVCCRPDSVHMQWPHSASAVHRCAYHMLAVLQACPCTHAAVCKADTYDLMDKKCRFKHNPVGSWNFIHGGG